MSAVSTIISVLFSILSNSHAQTQNQYDAIIMGAGAAGIAAAQRLYEENITNILIIEAQDYLGGRTKVTNFSNIGFNIGASWISGACIDIDSSNCTWYNETNPMLTAANKYGFSWVLSDYTHGEILDFGGTVHNVTNTNKRYAKFSEAMACAWNIYENLTSTHEYQTDMSYFALLRLCGWSAPRTAIDKTVQWVNFEFEAQKMKWSSGIDQYTNEDRFGTYDRYGTDDLFITDPRGYQGILKAIANEFLDTDNEAQIILSSPITTIEYGQTGVTVTLENNTQYSADYGIVTFSLGVLQSDIVEFVPELPQWKMEPLFAFDFIDYTPILVKWPHNFWDDTLVNISEFILLNDDRFGFFTWIYNFDHPNLWNGSLVWRFDLSLDLAQLVQYESINDTIQQIIDLKLSHYFDEVPEPEDIIVATWHTNKYVQGSYSNWPPGFTDEHKQAMGWPLEQRLFFSGEAYDNFGYGFVHSAYLSGNNTVYEILACMGHESALLNGFECPSEYVPPSEESDCASVSESALTEFVWLWIVLAGVVGIVLGVLATKFCSNRVANNKVVDSGDNYGAAAEADMDVPMVRQTIETGQNAPSNRL